jgi:hypothetical protein
MLASVLVALALVGVGYWLYRRLARYRTLSVRSTCLLGAAGLLAACLVIPAEKWLLDAAGIDLVVPPGAGFRASWQAMLAMLLFVVPLEEAIKVGIVWPLYLRHRLSDGMVGVRYAVFIALGFAAGETLVHGWMVGSSWLTLLRTVLAIPAHVFFAGLWGYVLGGTARQRHFFLTFVVCTALHAIYDHIVFARGAALLVVAVPMFATMAWGEWALFRNSATRSQLPTSVYTLFEPASVGSMRRAMSARGHALKVHWIFLGALVNLGVTLTFLAGAVYAGHQFNVDFALVEDSTGEGVLPVLFLAGGLLASFPVSAYLVARASGTNSVLEPAWAMAASIIFVLAIFSVTEPLAIVIAVGLAPVGFLLACAGAILGFRAG